VLPGIMPINNKAMVKRMAEMSGAALPGWLADRLDATDDPAEVRRIGVDVATQLCLDLIDAGTPGLHLYALNRPESVVEICLNLGLTTA
jgi:methylenetetrahydrofolate reductase (NADPH)